VSSIYAIRIFELLMQFKTTGVVVIALEEFRLLLELEDKYDRFTNLKARVLDPAIRELTAKANLDIAVDLIRRNRKVVSLRFTFSENPQGVLGLDD